MPIYEVKNPATGMWHSFDFSGEPTDDDFNEVANMLATEVDTGQSELSSAASSFGRGVASVPSGVVGGLGAAGEMVGLRDNALSRAGQAMDDFSREVMPINPQYEDGLMVETAGVLGQATGQIATIPVGGFAGRGISALKGLEGVTRAAQIARTAQQAAVGTGFALGADAGVETANRLGIDNYLQRALMVLGSAGIEGGSEMMGGFGTREFTEGVLGRLPGFLRDRNYATDALAEGFEELTAGAGQPVLERAVLLGEEAPSGSELTPLPTDSAEAFGDWLKQGAYGAVAGGYMTGLNAITSSPDNRQVLGWLVQAKAREQELNSVAEKTPEQQAELDQIKAKQNQAKSWVENSFGQVMNSVEEVLDPESQVRQRWQQEIESTEDPETQLSLIQQVNDAIRRAGEIAQENDQNPIASPDSIDAIVEEVLTPPPAEQQEAIQSVATNPAVVETQAAIDQVASAAPGVAEELNKALEDRVQQAATEVPVESDQEIIERISKGLMEAQAERDELDIFAYQRRNRAVDQPENPLEDQMLDLESLVAVMQEEKARAKDRLRNQMRQRIGAVEDQAVLNQVIDQERQRAQARETPIEVNPAREAEIEDAWLNSPQFTEAEEAVMAGFEELAEQIEADFRENYVAPTPEAANIQDEQGQETLQPETGTQTLESGDSTSVASEDVEVLPEQDLPVVQPEQATQTQEEDSPVDQPSMASIRDKAAADAIAERKRIADQKVSNEWFWGQPKAFQESVEAEIATALKEDPRIVEAKRKSIEDYNNNTMLDRFYSLDVGKEIRKEIIDSYRDVSSSSGDSELQLAENRLARLKSDLAIAQDNLNEEKEYAAEQVQTGEWTPDEQTEYLESNQGKVNELKDEMKSVRSQIKNLKTSAKKSPRTRSKKGAEVEVTPPVEIVAEEKAPINDGSAEYEDNLRRESEGITSWTEERIQQSVDWFRNGQQGDIPFGRPVVMRSIPGAVEEQEQKNRERERNRKIREGKFQSSPYIASPSADASVGNTAQNARPTHADAIEGMEIIKRSRAGRAVADSTFIAQNLEDYNRQNPTSPLTGALANIRGLEGLYIKSTGEVVVFLDNISPKEGESLAKAVARVAVHERIFHGGVQWMYNNSPDFARKMDAIAGKIPEAEKQAIILRYNAAGVPSKNISIVEEWMAQKLQGQTVDQLVQGDSLFRQIWEAFKDFVSRVLGMPANSVAVENEARSLINDVMKSPSALLGEPTIRVPDRQIADYSINAQSFSRTERQNQLDQLLAQGAPRELVQFHDFLGTQTDQAYLQQQIEPMANDFRATFWTGGLDDNRQPLVNDENILQLERLNDSSLNPNWGDILADGFRDRASQSSDPVLQKHKGDVYAGVALNEMANLAQLAMADGHPLAVDLVARAERYANDVLISSYLTYSSAGRLLSLRSLASRASANGLNFWKGLKERQSAIAKDVSNKVGTKNQTDLTDAVETVTPEDVQLTDNLKSAETEIQRYSGQQFLNDDLMDWVKEEDEKPFSSFRSAIEQDGIEKMVDSFFRDGPQRALPGPLVEGSDMINRTMSELMNDALDSLGIARAPGRPTPTARERIVRELGLEDVRKGKMREFGIALEARIAEVAAGNPEFTKQLMDQWEIVSSFMRDSTTPGSLSRRVIQDALKARAEQNSNSVAPGIAPPKIVKGISDLAKLTPAQLLAESDKLLAEIRENIRQASLMQGLDGTTSEIDPAQLDASMRSIGRVLAAMVGNSQNQMAKNANNNAVKSAGIKPLVEFILQQPYQHQNDPQKMAGLLHEWLVQSAGFSPADAQAFAAKYTPAFQLALNNARASAVEKVAKRIKSLQKKTLDDIVQAVRVGMSDPTGDIHKMIAESLGYKPFTPAALKEMAAIDLRTRDVLPTELAVEKKKLKDLLAQFAPPMTTFNRTYQSFVYSVLSGLGTMGLGFTVPAYASLVRMGSMSAGIVGDIAIGRINKRQGADAVGAMIGDYIDAYKNWVADFQHHWANDRMSLYHVQSVQELTGMQEDMKRSIQQFKDGNPAQKVTAALKIAQASTDIVRKVMNSSDGAAARLFQSVLTRKGARDLLMQGEEGMNTGEIGDMMAASTESGRKAAQRYLLKYPNAKSYDAQQVAVDASNQSILQFLSERLGPDAAEQVQKYAENEARLEIGTIDREKGAMWDVPHFIAEVVKNASAFAGEQNPLLGRLILGFVSIPVNLANRSLAFTPWGLVRSAIKQYEVNKGIDPKLYISSMGTEMQLRQRWTEGVAGSVAMMILSAFAFAGADDDEETYTGIRITLNGPEDRNLRDAWLKRGNRPNSVSWVIDGKPAVSFNFNRGGPEVLKMPLIAIGAINDMKLSGKLQDPSAVNLVAGWFQSAARGGAEASSFFGLKNMAQIPSMFDTRGTASDTSIASNIAWMGSGFIPWSGMAKNVTRAAQGQLDQSSVYAAIVAQTPVVNAILGQPALNFLGDQKGSAPVDLAGSVTNATAVSGMPFYVSTGSDGRNADLYALMIDKGETPSMPSRSRIEAKNGYITEEKWGAFVRVRGNLIKKAMRSQLTDLRKMDKTAFEKAMSNISSDATSEAKTRLKLK